jgi:alpha-L-fucosidase
MQMDFDRIACLKINRNIIFTFFLEMQMTEPKNIKALVDILRVDGEEIKRCINETSFLLNISVSQVEGVLLEHYMQHATHPPIGFIFHFGIYSVPAFCSRKTDGNGSEWYYKRLIETSTYRPITGSKETKVFHKKNYGTMEYSGFGEILREKFKHPKKHIKEWLTFAKNSGASYVIITAKHHDGFCLWNTKTTDKKLYPTKDLVKIFIRLANNMGLEPGVYYSWWEFDSGVTKTYLREIVEPQIAELIKYRPKRWWFDGHWMVITDYANKLVEELVGRIKMKIPEAIINDRLFGSKSEKKKRIDPNHLYKADIRVYGDRTFPEHIPEISWEYIFTVGHSWGYSNNKEAKYKTGKEIFELYEKTCELGGSFLINIGPNAEGDIEENEKRPIKAFVKKRMLTYRE